LNLKIGNSKRRSLCAACVPEDRLPLKVRELARHLFVTPTLYPFFLRQPPRPMSPSAHYDSFYHR
jgi:hypothetical protein